MRWNNREEFQKDYDKKRALVEACQLAAGLAEGLVIGEVNWKLANLLPFGPLAKTLIYLGVSIPEAIKAAEYSDEAVDKLISKAKNLPTRKEYLETICNYAYTVGVDIMMDKYSD